MKFLSNYPDSLPAAAWRTPAQYPLWYAALAVALIGLGFLLRGLL